MNIEVELQKIWSKDYILGLPDPLRVRGFMFSENHLEKDILITGFNPSFRSSDLSDCHNFDFQSILKNNKWDNYWSSLIKIIYNPNSNIDLRDKCAYLDIFYFREKEQALFRKHILKSQHGIQFAIDQLNLTQHTIEDIIKPKLIIIKNKESAAYWGKFSNQGIVWMGYQLDFIEKIFCGELFKISGLIDSPERIAPEIKETNLIGSIVLFTHHINQYTSIKKRPTATLINILLENFNSENLHTSLS